MNLAFTLTIVLAFLMLAQSALGLLFHAHYRDAAWITATWLGNDWVTLAVVVPVLAVAATFAARGSLRALLVWLGVLAYAIYNYAYYAFGAALNAFFPLYLAALLLAALSLTLALAAIAPSMVASRFDTGVALRIAAGYFVGVGISLAGIWMAMWAAYVFAGYPTPADTEAFKLVAALDTVLMVPPMVIGGLLLWRERPWGFVVTPIVGIQGSLYLLVLSINSLIAVGRGFVPAPGEFPIWSALATTTITATLLILTRARDNVEV